MMRVDYSIKGAMKKMSLFVLIFFILMMFGCKQELTKTDVYKRDGLVYSKQDKQPFTGILVGTGYEGYRPQKCSFKKEYRNGKLHGNAYYWYPNGALESIEPYDNGLLNGMISRFYPNGKRKAKVHMVNGLRGGNQGELFWDIYGNLM